MALLRQRWPLVSFTMLPTALVIDASRRQGMVWDAVFSCEMSGTYKPHPEAYRTTAQWLNLAPSEILMVACHNFDLDAARAVGFRCAFVRRPQEWGAAGPPDPHPNPANDFIADDFLDLARQLASRFN
jgi:2-haloacid dehalogenase